MTTGIVMLALYTLSASLNQSEPLIKKIYKKRDTYYTMYIALLLIQS
jgi:hypothetical protein